MSTSDGDHVSREAGIALWRQVAARLAAEIKRREGADARLPSEQDLARRFGVNRHTIRQALRVLAQEGLVRAEQGRGTFVAGSAVAYPLGPRTRFTASLEAQDRVPSRRMLAAETLALDAAGLPELGLAAGALVHRVRSLLLADGVPIGLGIATLPAEHFPDAPVRLAADPSLTRLLAGYGHGDYRRGTTRVLARLPDAEEALLLEQAVRTPVLVSEGVDVDAAGAALMLSTSIWAAERVQFVVGAPAA